MSARYITLQEAVQYNEHGTLPCRRLFSTVYTVHYLTGGCSVQCTQYTTLQEAPLRAVAPRVANTLNMSEPLEGTRVSMSEELGIYG